MGIVNVTPDSFSDGGRFNSVDAAVEHGLQLVEEGADILDIGGESTRPGAETVTVEQELDRVIPVIEKLVQQNDSPISIDTSKPQVMQAAIAAGAAMVNDVRALQTSGAIESVADSAVYVCLMHMQQQPQTMQQNPSYKNVVQEVVEFLKQRSQICEKHGISRDRIIVDPGIGFGKTIEHNLALLKAVPELAEQTDSEVLIGVSRKSMIDHLLNREVDQRMAASVGLAVQAALNGAKIVRVHDVRASFDAIRCVEAVAQA